MSVQYYDHNIIGIPRDGGMFYAHIDTIRQYLSDLKLQQDELKVQTHKLQYRILEVQHPTSQHS
jgi:hypothetical protein